MALIDIKGIQAQAKKEIVEETSKKAIEKLKELYRQQEKARLVLKNLDREIAGYLSEVADNVTYEDAGVDTTK